MFIFREHSFGFVDLQESAKRQITKTGFMYKQGGGKVSKSWKYRLFVLYGGVLSYYQVTNQKRELKGEIPLSSVKAVSVSEEVEQMDKEGNKKPERGYQFDVFTPNRIYKVPFHTPPSPSSSSSSSTTQHYTERMTNWNINLCDCSWQQRHEKRWTVGSKQSNRGSLRLRSSFSLPLTPLLRLISIHLSKS